MSKSRRSVVVTDSWSYVIAYCYENDLKPNEIIHVDPSREDTWHRVAGLEFSENQIHLQGGIQIPSYLTGLLYSRVRHANNG